MNRYTVSLVALAIAVSMRAGAQESTQASGILPEARLVKAEQNYLCCLSSENDGLVESAIAMVARLRILYPERSLPGLREKLYDLAINGQTASIRFKSYLVSTVLDDLTLPPPEQVAGLDNSELFALIAGRLQKSLLGYSHP
jgi:hypothetical protein